MGDEAQDVADMVGQAVVVDTRSMLIHIGTLTRWGEAFVELSDCDVHDVQEDRSTKELYAMESARDGVRQNRRRVLIRKEEVVSVSSLADVIVF